VNQRRMRSGRPKHQSFTRLIPNMLTLLNLCAGVTAIRFALGGRFEEAVAAILLAGVLDLLDGGMARLLRAGSKLGAELDSLADLVSFGVAPAVMVYAWTMHSAGGIGWVPSLLFCACSALRLARFNITRDDPSEPSDPSGAYSYFTGLPTPGAAGVLLLPMLFWFQFPEGPFNGVFLNGIFTVGAALLMVSRIPTFSLKGGRIPNRYVVPLLVLFCLVVGFAVETLWATLSVVMVVYIATIPVSLIAYRRRLQKSSDEIAPTRIDGGE
jgi:CDP-diacylglycerol--serine O-phosphatidyltransferase